jgi:methylenetetrahydrofolate reductase (NADPH)
MTLADKIKERRFVVTAEVGPPKGTNVDACLEEAELLRRLVDALNVTDLQGSVMRLGSLAVCHLLASRGIEPVYQLTCRDRNRLALQSDLLSAYALGIRNMLALTGDHPLLGDHPGAKPVFDLDSVSLLSAASQLMQGHDMTGHELDGSPDFLLGAAVNPGSDPIELQLMKMEKKVAAGARFFQTQAVFDLDRFAAFMQRAQRIGVPILGGVLLLKSAGMAHFLNQKVAGISVPDRYLKMLAGAPKEERPAVSVTIARELAVGMRNLCQGVHIMPLGWAHHVPQLLHDSGLEPGERGGEATPP